MDKEFCVGCFIVDGQRFLFGKRSDLKAWYPGDWDVFGGHSLPRESAADTLKRELKEELGILPTTYELFSTVDIVEECKAGIRYYIYFVTSWLDNPVNCSDEHSEIRWFLREELDSITLASERYLELVDAWTCTKKHGDDSIVSKDHTSPAS